MLTPSVNDNNLNDIPVPMKCEHEYTICNSLFQTNEQDEYTCELCTWSNQIQREWVESAIFKNRQKEWYPEVIRFYDHRDNVTIPMPSVDRKWRSAEYFMPSKTF